MSNPFQMTADQLAQLRVIFDAQMQLPREQQIWQRRAAPGQGPDRDAGRAIAPAIGLEKSRA
jgi:hypothetical protein